MAKVLANEGLLVHQAASEILIRRGGSHRVPQIYKVAGVVVVAAVTLLAVVEFEDLQVVYGASLSEDGKMARERPAGKNPTASDQRFHFRDPGHSLNHSSHRCRTLHHEPSDVRLGAHSEGHSRHGLADSGGPLDLQHHVDDIRMNLATNHDHGSTRLRRHRCRHIFYPVIPDPVFDRPHNHDVVGKRLVLEIERQVVYAFRGGGKSERMSGSGTLETDYHDPCLVCNRLH